MSMTRRRFLVVMGSGVVGAATAQAIREWNDPARAVMPPGAVSLSHLKRSCTACGLCMASCPSKVLVPADSCDYGRTLFGGALLPKLDFSRGACDPSCARCAEVCPAQAFLRFEHPSERRRVDARELPHLVRRGVYAVQRAVSEGRDFAREGRRRRGCAS